MKGIKPEEMEQEKSRLAAEGFKVLFETENAGHFYTFHKAYMANANGDTAVVQCSTNLIGKDVVETTFLPLHAVKRMYEEAASFCDAERHKRIKQVGAVGA